MGRWCDCIEPVTRGIAYRRCLKCGKLIRKDGRIPKVSTGVDSEISEEEVDRVSEALSDQDM